MLCFLSDYDLKYLNLCWSESCLLVSAVKFNQNLKDLFLGDNKLTSPDGQSLGAMLKGNGYLQLLDLRNNPLQVRHTTCNKIVFFLFRVSNSCSTCSWIQVLFSDAVWLVLEDMCHVFRTIMHDLRRCVFLCLSQAVFICWLKFCWLSVKF